jgi:hypothetical protein
VTKLHPIEKIKKSIDLILQYDKSLFIEKLRLGEMSSDAARCDLEQIFGMTAHIKELPIDCLVEQDRASLDAALDQIDDLFRKILDYDAATIADMEGKLKENIRERVDHFHDVTLSWMKMMKYMYETT